jgi:two-component system response regulator MprA
VVLIGGSLLEPRPGPLCGPILVIDDDDAVRGALDAALSAEGYEVVTAPDGVAALDAVAIYSFDLIILDIRMSRMDGPEFARAYAGVPGRHAPTLILSSAADVRGLAQQIGADAYLGKPFELDDLLTLVARYAGEPSRPD